MDHKQKAKEYFNRISVHHVGGRAGSRVFPVLDKFEGDIINVLYDADPDCLEQIRQRNKCLKSELYVLPYCVAETCKKGVFSINYDPYTSSLKEFNQDYSSYYTWRDCDYMLSQAFKSMKKLELDLVSLDYIFQSDNPLVPPPDFLSLDTQGSEYEILLGAKKTLNSNVLALAIEVGFHPHYKGQKLFGEISAFLSEQGFDFIIFPEIFTVTPFRAPVGLRGEGFQSFADALFFRNINQIENSNGTVDYKCYSMLRKLAFIAIIFNQFEFALQCLNKSKQVCPFDTAAGQEEGLAYCKFLREFEDCFTKMQKIFPPTFNEKYSFEESKARFKDTACVVPNSPVKSLLRNFPAIFQLLKGVKNILFMLKVSFQRCLAAVKERIDLLFGGNSGIEVLFFKYCLKEQAQLLRKNRIKHLKSCKR